MTEWPILESDFHSAKEKGIRDGLGDALVELGRERWNVATVCADLDDSIRFQEFAKKYPERAFQVGVAEQNLIGVAAGLAKESLTVFAGSYAAFSPGRTYDQIRVSVCYSNRNVKIVGGHAGLSVGPDGATHQMMEDLAMMQALPNMTVLVPSDYESAFALTKQAAELSSPVYIRSSRVKTRTLAPRETIQLGQATQLLDGNDLTLLACGIMVDRALQLAYDLKKERGMSARVVNVHTLKPLDVEAVVLAAQETKRLVVIEEHQVFGGLGSAVAQTLAQHCPTPLEIIGMNDEFGRSGEPEALLQHFGFSRGALLERTTSFLSRWS